MNWVRIHTSGGGGRGVSHMILGMLFLALGGCSSSESSRTTHLVPKQPSVRHPATVIPNDNQHIRTAASEELGTEARSAIPVVQRSAPAPMLNDPGAIVLVQVISDRMGARVFGADGVSRIGLMQVKNQSRATSAEFDAFRERLAALLNRASSEARRGNLDFVSDANQEVHYHVQGTAYLITVGGFDVWELFLSMTPASESFSIWQADRPVRVLRQVRPGQPQIVAW